MTIQELFDSLLAKHNSLRSAVLEVLQEKDEDKVREQMILRDEYRDSCQRLANGISDNIAELEKMKRKIGEWKREQATDISKLEQHLYSVIRTRKYGS